MGVLQNAECTNAGVGSNLTLDGCVECDASMMDGKSLLFGAVGAVPGCYFRSHIARKPVFGVSDQVQHKPGCKPLKKA